MPRPRVGAVVCCLGSVLLIVLSGCGGGGSSSSLPTGSFQLSVQAMGGGGGTISSTPAGINCGQTCSASFASGSQVALTASPAANSSFAGWSGACSGSGACKVTLTQNTSVMANFSTSPVLTVALAGNGTGSVSSDPSGINNCEQTCSAAFAAGTMVTLSATAGANSSFAGWTGGGCGSGPTCVVTISASEKITATFTPTQGAAILGVIRAGTGTGTVTSSPAGINCGTTCNASFPLGTQVTLTATPSANSTFAGWTGGNCSTSPSCVVTLAASENVTATFNIIQSEPVLTVIVQGSGTGTVTSSPAGINCPQTCNASFNTGTQVTLTATPATGSSFAGWGGACSGSSPTCVVTLSTSLSATANFNLGAPLLTVTLAGNSTGTVSSSPAGINCPQTCSANFAPGTQVTLTETPGGTAYFAGWGEACSGFGSTCTLTLNASETATATFNLANITAINHIIFMAQENRNFDHYFGALRAYWAANSIPDQSLDGLPQFNPTSGIPPLYGPPPTNPGCDPTVTTGCKLDNNSPQVESFKLITECIENPGDEWSQSHIDWNVHNPVSPTPTLDGYLYTAAGYARRVGFNDIDGIRAMGYYDDTDLNYYYFMATKFATSDRWFAPVMTRTPSNREYLVGGTSQGYVHTIPKSKPPLSATPIFEVLQNAGISWKIYVNPTGSSCTGPPYDPVCLLTLSSIQVFQWGQTIPTKYPHNLGTIGIDNSDFDNDLASGNLPQVVEIEPASDAGLDEHPSESDTALTNIQKGANYVSSLINQVMASSAWQDSAFILTYDEFGGPFDHVAPQPAVSPDGIKPVDLRPNDVCYPPQNGPNCDFVYTGFRLPLIVVSPFTKQNYVSHSVADTTAILKLIETRFGLPPLTKRDAAQIDMTEFFDFSNPPWLAPPTPPAQFTNGPCYQNKLP